MRPGRRLPLIRVALVSALVGHWIANAIADPGEYAVVGLRYEGAALRPILIQTGWFFWRSWRSRSLLAWAFGAGPPASITRRPSR